MEKWIISSEEEEENNIEDMVGKSEELGVRSRRGVRGEKKKREGLGAKKNKEEK